MKKGHHLAGRRGADSNAWKGGRTHSGNGYIWLFAPDHPRTDAKGYVPEHTLVAEKALGHFLPVGAIVHHVNRYRQENQNDNLVVCSDAAYHQLLHLRQRAFDATGNPNMRRCVLCKLWDLPDANGLVPAQRCYRHRNCHALYMRKRSAA